MGVPRKDRNTKLPPDIANGGSAFTLTGGGTRGQLKLNGTFAFRCAHAHETSAPHEARWVSALAFSAFPSCGSLVDDSFALDYSWCSYVEHLLSPPLNHRRRNGVRTLMIESCRTGNSPHASAWVGINTLAERGGFEPEGAYVRLQVIESTFLDLLQMLCTSNPMISNCPSAASVFCKELNPFPLLARKMLMRYQRPNAGICEAAVIRVSNYEHLSIRRPVVNAAIGHADFGLPAFSSSAVLDLDPEPASLSGYPGSSTGDPSAATRVTDLGAVATLGSAHRAVSGFASVSDSGCIHVSRTSRRGRSMGNRASRFDGRRLGKSRGSAALGPERQSAHCVSLLALGNMDKNLSWTCEPGTRCNDDRR